MKYNVGDVVIIHKPENIWQDPKWLPDMDEYDKKVAVITEVKEVTYGHYTFVKIENDGGRWKFNVLWLEPYEDREDEEFLKEDIWNLM